MHFLPLPRTVVPAVVVATVVLLIWLAWGSMRDPETFWAPGDLSRYHADVVRCMNCHEAFRGAVATKCILCHSEVRFAERSMPPVATFHQDLIRQKQSCLGCHTEHRGVLAELTSDAMRNPHGEFVFVVTGASSCMACHEFGSVFGARPTLIDNDIVHGVMAKGGGAHRPGYMANCLQCHASSVSKSTSPSPPPD